MKTIKCLCIAILCLASLSSHLPLEGELEGVPPHHHTIEIVDKPPAGGDLQSPTIYPLHGGFLKKLPVGQVKPKGWLLEVLTRQKNGLNGQLGTVSEWLDKQDNQWLSDQGSHGWEEVPYWLRGYTSLAYILNDTAMIQEANQWIEAVLTHQKDNGELGPSITDGNPHIPDLWPKMPMLWALQTYYEATRDQRVLTAMTNYFKWEINIPDQYFLKGYWQSMRGGDNQWSVVWLYNQTGDTTILPLIEKLHRCGADWTMTNDLPNWHGVNVAQGFREPATYYIYSGDQNMLQAAYNNHHNIRQRYGQVPGGMYGADENARPGYTDPRQGAETCAIVEQMASDQIMMAITGDPFWADHCENVAFNSLPAALMPDMRSLRYITAPNMAISDGKNYGGSIDNHLTGMLSMSPFSSRCCQHNHGFGWPYFAEHLVMATNDGGLCTTLYSASETRTTVARGDTVTLIQQTNYPFQEDITLTIRCTHDVNFPLYLRIPAWAQQATVQIVGKDLQSSPLEGELEGVILPTPTSEGICNPQPIPPGKYVKIQRTWKDREQIQLHLPMNITSHTWEQNKGSVSVNYGPLTLSLKIAEQYRQRDPTDDDILQFDSHWQQHVDKSQWHAWEIFPQSPWNYALKIDKQNLPVDITIIRKPWPADNYPFTLQAVPIQFTAKAYRVPAWGFDDKGMTDTLPITHVGGDLQSPNLTLRGICNPRLLSPLNTQQEEIIQLVPMGAARLRISAFPTAHN